MSTGETSALAPRTLMTGVGLGESPRWHDDRLWFADWGAQAIIAVDLQGESEVVSRIPSAPFSIDWLSDGRLLIVSANEGILLRREPDGSLVTHADLTRFSSHPWNEIVVDGRGNTYINNLGFDLVAGDSPNPGIVVRVTPDGSVDLQTIDLDRSCFACMLGGPDDRTLFMPAAEWTGSLQIEGPPTGQVLTIDAPAPGVGRP
jgi:sugar lactone lactonase YvrE